MVDPRTSIIAKRMRDAKRIVAISSGKGGVGKSLVASCLALSLASKGCCVGLFDLDFTSPSTHVILGVEGVQPKEEGGLVPPVIHGFEYMSIAFYSKEHAVPLRGVDVSNVLIELLSVTKWSQLNFLVLDMPPGIGDATLDLLRLVSRIEFLVVTTPSRLAFETVRKLVSLLKELRAPIVGVVENMKMDTSDTIQRETLRLGLEYLAGLPYDPYVEASIGNVDRLRKTTLYRQIDEIASRL